MDNNQNISNQSIDAILNEFLNEETVEEDNLELKKEEKVEEIKEKELEVVEEDFFTSLDDKFFKTNKLTPFNNEDGTDYIVPKTMDEFVELLDANREHWMSESKYQQKEEVLADIFKETTPAFQFLAKNANLYKSIEDMYPLMQSVQAQDDLDGLDLENIEHQEYIIRAALAIQGFDENGINEEILDLKERSKLATKAQTLKPVLDKIQADTTQKLLEEEDSKNKEDQKFWNGYYNALNEQLITAKDLDGMVLKNDDKVRVANNLIPATDGSGLPIFEKLDELVGKGDLKTLAIISMILEDRALFDSYYANKTHLAAGQSSARTLRTNVTSKTSEEDITPKKQAKKETDMSKTYGVFL